MTGSAAGPGQAPVGIVLTGGASSRMGSDKSLIEVDGMAMAARVARALTLAGCDPVWCQGGDTEALVALGLSVVEDALPGEGPLAAIETALNTAAPADIVVCACDLADVESHAIEALVSDAIQHPEALVLVATDPSGPHLLSYWRADAAERLTDLLAGGARAYRAALAAFDAVPVPVESRVIRNINRPSDLATPS